MIAAKAVHIGLYVPLLAMPLSGWLMASTTLARVPTFVFALFDLPSPLALELSTYRFAHPSHVASADFTRVAHRITQLVQLLLWRTIPSGGCGRAAAERMNSPEQPKQD